MLETILICFYSLGTTKKSNVSWSLHHHRSTIEFSNDKDAFKFFKSIHSLKDGILCRISCISIQIMSDFDVIQRVFSHNKIQINLLFNSI